VIDLSELSGTYIIYCFLGTVDPDYTQWATSPNSVGAFNNIGAPNHHKQSRAKKSRVPLTSGLKQRSIDTDSVPVTTEYLKHNLNWGIVQDGQKIDVTTLKTLRVAVTSTTVTIPASLDTLPVWGSPTHYFNVTSDKDCGASQLGQLNNPLLVGGGHATPDTTTEDQVVA